MSPRMLPPSNIRSLFSTTPILTLLAVATPAAARAQSCTLELVSKNSLGHQGNVGTTGPYLSATGRYVAFVSEATNLVHGDTNGVMDAFVHDRQTGSTIRVSVSSSGEQANAETQSCIVTPDGRFVTFVSYASNLVPGDTNSTYDVFVRDLSTGVTTRESVSSLGEQANDACAPGGISDDGRFVVMQGYATNLVPNDTNDSFDIFVRDRSLGTTVRANVDALGNQAFGHSFSPSISANGRSVAFTSEAGLVPNDTQFMDVYVKDLVTGAIVLADVDSNGIQANHESSFFAQISADGRSVGFDSEATNLVPGDTNGVGDSFVRDLVTGITTRVSVSSLGEQGDAPSGGPNLSSDGRYAVFASSAITLDPAGSNGFMQIFVRDRQTGITACVSRSALGHPAGGSCGSSWISADGSVVAFDSVAADLVAGDGNAAPDIFVRACPFPPPATGTLFCAGSASSCPCGNVGRPIAGCENSFATGGGVLAATGVASLSADSVTLRASGLTPSAPALFVQGTGMVAGGTGVPLADGLSCVNSSLTRLGIHLASHGITQFGWSISADLPLSIYAGLPPTGGTRFYQVVYRNVVPFCTPGTFNSTNGLEILWSP